VSDAEGFYRAPQLRPGIYAISVTANGFSTAVREGVEARVNDRLRVDMPMQIAWLPTTWPHRGVPRAVRGAPVTATFVVNHADLHRHVDAKPVIDARLHSLAHGGAEPLAVTEMA